MPVAGEPGGVAHGDVGVFILLGRGVILCRLDLLQCRVVRASAEGNEWIYRFQ